jgi:ribosomal protein S8E
MTFTPEDPTTTVTAGSGDYLYFGYWLHKPDAPGGAHPFMTFAGGMQPFVVRGDNPTTTVVERDRANITAPERDRISLVHLLTGTARFKGPAAGKYVTREVLGQSAMIGQFTATAELLADFDAGTTTTVTAPGTVTGVVQDFMDAEDGADLSNWHVTLGSASLMAIGAAPGINEGVNRTAEDDAAGRADNSFINGRTEAGMSITQFNGSTDARLGGAAIDGVGRWVGQFYGNARSDGKPNAIAGVFDAHAGHASISGAFGSENTAQ